MNNKKYHVLGMMSGTSLDGLDLAYCTFEHKDTWHFTIEIAETLSYAGEMQRKLKDSIEWNAVNLLSFHQEYGTWLGKQAKAFIDKYQLKLDFIASHGHTIHHRPEKQFTFQLGDGQALAIAAQLPVYADFRSKDVALGGQGAPLVPIGDHLLFANYAFCLNLGGIVNASFIHQKQRVAFDITAINMLFNPLAQALGKTYDKDGELARGGSLNEGLVNQLNTLAFYKLPFPKSLGYEWFVQEMFPIVNRFDISITDKLHTAVHHVAQQTAKALLPYAKDKATLLATGGGAKNSFFMETLQSYLGEDIQIVIPQTQLIDFKEAMVFAFMGVLKSLNQTNCIHSVTGAKYSSSGGILFTP